MIRYLLANLFILSFIFCQSQNVRIYGNVIDNIDYSSVILSPAIASKLLDSKIETNPKNGFFEFNIIVPNACFYKLYYKSKRINLFVKPGANIQLTIENSKDQNFVVFYENLIQENTLLQLETTPYLGNKKDRQSFKQAALQGQDIYFKEVDLANKARQVEWEAMTEEVNFDSDFIDLYRKNYMEMAAYLYKYYYPRYLGFNQDSFIVSQNNYLDYYKDMPDISDYYFCPLYFENKMNVLKGKVNMGNKEKILKNNVDDLELYKSYIREAELVSDGYVRGILIENLIGEWVNSYGRTSDLKDEIVAYIEQVTDSDKKNVLKKRLVNLAQYETGQPAPNFSFEDYSGNKRNSRELLGKIVYIHVWSSSNASSMNEWNAARQIYAKYKDNQDLIFLFLSIDDEKDAWERVIREKKLFEDIHAISFPHGYNSDFARKYAIQSLPSYLLIDKSGNIISNRVPRPSQPEKLIPLLDKLLGL
jgi:hypothetical protein